MSKILSFLVPAIQPLLIVAAIAGVFVYVNHLNTKVAQLEVAAQAWETRLKALNNALSTQAEAMANIQDTTSQLSDRLRKLQLPKLVEKDPDHAATMANSLYSDTQCLLERASGAKRDCSVAGAKANKAGKR